MGCLSGVARVLLVVINIVFLLLGLALTAVGFLLRYGQSVYKPFLEFGLFQLQKALKETNLGDFNVEDIDMGEALLSLALGLIIGGLVLFGIAFFGCCGACCKFKLLLWIYALIIIVFVVGEAVGIGLLYGKPDLVKDHLKSTLNDYQGLGGKDVNSLTWNVMMIQFKCCGVDDYKDFDTTLPWAKPTGGVTLETPVACCKKLPETTALTCAKTYNEATSNGMNGCYDTIWRLSFGYTAAAVPVLVVCGIIQILFIALAILIAKDDKDKVSPI